MPISYLIRGDVATNHTQSQTLNITAHSVIEKCNIICRKLWNKLLSIHYIFTKYWLQEFCLVWIVIRLLICNVHVLPRSSVCDASGSITNKLCAWWLHRVSCYILSFLNMWTSCEKYINFVLAINFEQLFCIHIVAIIQPIQYTWTIKFWVLFLSWWHWKSNVLATIF